MRYLDRLGELTYQAAQLIPSSEWLTVLAGMALATYLWIIFGGRSADGRG